MSDPHDPKAAGQSPDSLASGTEPRHVDTAAASTPKRKKKPWGDGPILLIETATWESEKNANYSVEGTDYNHQPIGPGPS